MARSKLLPPISLNAFPFNLIVASLFCITSLSANSTDLTAVNGGLVNGHGNSILSGNPYGTYENIDIVIGGTPSEFWSSTTEAIIVNNNTLKATENVNISNTTKAEGLSNNGGIRLQGGSTVNFTNLDTVRIVSLGGSHTSNESVAITLDSTGSSNSISISGKTVQLIGSIEFRSIVGTSTANITLDGEDSFWYGSWVNNAFWGRSTFNLSLRNGATWVYDADNESGQSEEGHLPSIELSGGRILISDSVIHDLYRNTTIDNAFGDDFTLSDFRDPKSHYTHVTLDNVTGTGGTFVMDINWLSNQGQKSYAEDGTSDFIQIGSVESGSTQSILFDQSKAHLDEMNVGDKLYFASVKEGDTTFITNADGEYNSASELYTFNFESQSEWSENDSLTYWYLTKTPGHTNENVSLMKDVGLASYFLASDLDRFRERRGEAQYVNQNSDGLWVRYRFSNTEFNNAFDMSRNMIQIGYDRDVSNSGSRKILGIAVDYTQADTDLLGLSGNGDSDRYGLNFYYTLLASCGGYADFTVKIGRLSNDYNARNNSGADIGASFWQTYYGIGAEVGYKYDFKNNAYIEPQAQLQIVRIEEGKFTSNGGIKTTIDDVNSVIGRFGIRAGYNFDSISEQQKNALYVSADVMHEFDGDSNFYAIGRSLPYKEKISGSETWYDIGIGTNLFFSNNSKVWFDTKHIFGGIYDNSWQINAGINVAF